MRGMECLNEATTACVPSMPGECEWIISGLMSPMIFAVREEKREKKEGMR